MCPFVLSKRTTFFPPRRGPWAVHAVTCRLPACRVAAPLLGLVLPVPDVGLTECNKAVFGLLLGALNYTQYQCGHETSSARARHIGHDDGPASSRNFIILDQQPNLARACCS